MLEMLVVLAVLGLVYALALPALSGVLPGPRLDGEARHLVAAVREARATAIVGGREVRFLVTGRAWRFADRNGTVHEKLTLTLEAPSGGAVRRAISALNPNARHATTAMRNFARRAQRPCHAAPAFGLSIDTTAP